MAGEDHRFRPERDQLSVQWYRFDAAVDSWSSLPIMSGQLFARFSAGGPSLDPPTGEDAYWGNTGAALTDVPPACIRPGRYRVELYLNGRLQGTARRSRLLSTAPCWPATSASQCAVLRTGPSPGRPACRRGPSRPTGLAVWRSSAFTSQRRRRARTRGLSRLTGSWRVEWRAFRKPGLGSNAEPGGRTYGVGDLRLGLAPVRVSRRHRQDLGHRIRVGHCHCRLSLRSRNVGEVERSRSVDPVDQAAVGTAPASRTA